MSTFIEGKVGENDGASESPPQTGQIYNFIQLRVGVADTQGPIPKLAEYTPKYRTRKLLKHLRLLGQKKGSLSKNQTQWEPGLAFYRETQVYTVAPETERKHHGRFSYCPLYIMRHGGGLGHLRQGEGINSDEYRRAQVHREHP